MPKSIVAFVVLFIGLIGYIVGASFPWHATSVEAVAPEHTGQVVAAPREQGVPADSRVDALLRETRDVNRGLRAAIAELTAELRARHEVAAATTGELPASATAEQWAARLRAREPDVVMESVCRLRERMLTRALLMDAEAKSAVGPIVGISDADQLQQEKRDQEQRAKMYRDQADRCRTGNKELDAVRTLDELAHWRVAFGESE